MHDQSFELESNKQLVEDNDEDEQLHKPSHILGISGLILGLLSASFYAFVSLIPNGRFLIFAFIVLSIFGMTISALSTKNNVALGVIGIIINTLSLLAQFIFAIFYIVVLALFSNF